jgi:hypothetical protein
VALHGISLTRIISSDFSLVRENDRSLGTAMASRRTRAAPQCRATGAPPHTTRLAQSGTPLLALSAFCPNTRKIYELT